MDMTSERTGPFAHMKSAFTAAHVALPEIGLQIRSVTLIKRLVARAEFIMWMSESKYDTEKAIDILGRLKPDKLHAPRTLTAFRRCGGILPAREAKLLEEPRSLTRSKRESE